MTSPHRIHGDAGSHPRSQTFWKLQCWRSSMLLIVGFALCVLAPGCSATDTDIALDAKATLNHRIQSLDLLVFVFLLALTVLTIWLFKHHRVSWLHETGLAVIYGTLVTRAAFPFGHVSLSSKDLIIGHLPHSLLPLCCHQFRITFLSTPTMTLRAHIWEAVKATPGQK